MEAEEAEEAEEAGEAGEAGEIANLQLSICNLKSPEGRLPLSVIRMKRWGEIGVIG